MYAFRLLPSTQRNGVVDGGADAMKGSPARLVSLYTHLPPIFIGCHLAQRCTMRHGWQCFVDIFLRVGTVI
jgi:hypothetical protein